MREDVDVELEESSLGNRSLSVALGVLVVLSLLVLGYYYRRPAGGETLLLPTPSASPPTREVLPPPVEEGVLKVYVAGEVKKPGVVSLPAGSRVEDALEKAGGMTASADPLAINLASRLKDEQMIVVPARGASPSASPAVEVQPTLVPDSSQPPPASDSDAPEASSSAPPPPPEGGRWDQYLDKKGNKVSLNTGTQAELEAIPGVGPKTAADIIAYRKAHPFKTLQDLNQVPGIGDKKLEAISPYVDL